MPQAIGRPGAGALPPPDYGNATVTDDPRLNSQVAQMMPSLLARAPWGNQVAGARGPGSWTQEARDAWVTAEMRKAGVPLQDGQHVLANGTLIDDPSWWTKYGPAIMIVAGGLVGGYVLGNIGSGAGAVGAGTGGAAATGGAVSGGAVAGGAVAGGATAGGVTTGGILSALGTGTGIARSLLGSGSNSIPQTAAAIEAGRASGNVTQAGIQQRQDQLAQNRALLALRAPGIEAGNSVRGDILANSQDAQFSGLPSYIHIPTMSGGLRPSMLSQNSRDLGGSMSRNALAHQLSGDDVPNLTPLPQSNGLDTGLQVAAGAGSFLNALGGLGARPGANTNSPQPGNNFPWQGPTDQGPGWQGPINQPDPNQGLNPDELDWWNQQANGGGA